MTEGSDQSDSPDHDDSIARRLLEGTAFQRRRVTVGVTSLSQRRKLGVFAGIAGSLALVVPMGLTLPPAVATGFLGGAPLAASPAVLAVGLFGILAELAAGVTVTVVCLRAQGSELTEREALHLVAVDNVATMIGLGVGSASVLAVLCGFGVGYAGVEMVRTFGSSASGVGGPYASLDWLPSVAAFAALALGAGGILALSAVVLVDGDT